MPGLFSRWNKTLNVPKAANVTHKASAKTKDSCKRYPIIESDMHEMHFTKYNRPINEHTTTFWSQGYLIIATHRKQMYKHGHTSWMSEHECKH